VLPTKIKTQIYTYIYSCSQGWQYITVHSKFANNVLRYKIVPYQRNDLNSIFEAYRTYV